MSSDSDVSMSTQSMPKLISNSQMVQVKALKVVYVHYYCNVLCFEVV